MLPSAVSALAAVGVVAIAAFLFRRRGDDDRDAGGPSAGHAGAMLSALFLLVFAIAIIVPWTTADSARQNTYAESQAAVESYWAAAALPTTAVTAVRTELRDYMSYVLVKEWPMMAEGRMSADATTRLNTLRAQVAQLDAPDDAKSPMLDQLGALSAARRQRAADAGATPPPGLMGLTVLTGLVILVFPFLAGARPRGHTLLPLLVMAGLLGVGIYLTYDISHVFAGSLAVQPDAFRAALLEFQHIPATLPTTPSGT
ncbi:DUF4239 domain-containing protein [Streptosporangiaceae bacterium NEAU-GS5]|nr:DUF4239 domain-containing protein [Streptosporangiaceae bacterium NEAU-GS5]